MTLAVAAPVLVEGLKPVMIGGARMMVKVKVLLGSE